MINNSSPSFGSLQSNSDSNLSVNFKIGRTITTYVDLSTFTFITLFGFPPKNSLDCNTPWTVLQDGKYIGISSGVNCCVPSYASACSPHLANACIELGLRAKRPRTTTHQCVPQSRAGHWLGFVQAPQPNVSHRRRTEPNFDERRVHGGPSGLRCQQLALNGVRHHHRRTPLITAHTHCTTYRSLLSVSDPVSLPFQGTFHLSFTLLVRYRSLFRI